MIQNPILPGFHPDPSILRVENDYYIASSTFEWWPGVRLHHSRDLKHWRPIGYALTRQSQLDLRRLTPSAGVWAPSLTYNTKQKLFHLCYSVMYSTNCALFDLDNFLVTAPSIDGPWSDPVYLNSSGFDPSFLHDEDGRQWVVGLIWDFREGYEKPGYLAVQEYSAVEKRMIGPRHEIYRSEMLGCVEGPHLYRRGEYYYLMTAEGGTGYGHACLLARSRSITGPYEPSPYNPIFTSTERRYNGITHLDYRKTFLYNPNSLLQKSGHGSLVETSTGEAYIAHLCARPLLPELRSTLGRETGIQKVEWTEDGWLRLAGGGQLAQTEVPEPNLPAAPFPIPPTRDDFDQPTLGVDWSTLRQPFDESWGSLTARAGHLRLRGRQSLCSTGEISLVARRATSFRYRARTVVDFEPAHFQQMAGLVALYDHVNHYFLRVYHSDSLGGKCLGLMTHDNGRRSEHLDCRVPLGKGPVYLELTVHDHELKFGYSLDGQAWTPIGPTFDASKLSDEYCAGGQMTGSFVGVTAQDFDTRQSFADFDWFSYETM